MITAVLSRPPWISILLSLCLVGFLAPFASAIPSFVSHDNRLPNPDRPYEMTGGPVTYNAPPFFTVHDLEFEPSDPSQLDVPTQRDDGRFVFDSTFDITYRAVIGTATTDPPFEITGRGNAHAVGISRPDSEVDFAYLVPQVFDAELVSLILPGLSPIPEVMIRESPTLESKGIIIREDACPVCASPLPFWRISSFFDIFTEINANGGGTWTPADKAIHVEQAPDGLPPGDYNGDKVVDAGDYVVWRQTMGHRGAGLAADGDWSGKVDAGDYVVWRANFGQSSNADPTAASAITAAPEPTTGALVALGILMAGLSSRLKPICHRPT